MRLAQNEAWFFINQKYLNIYTSRPDPGRREKINLNVYFHSSLWCLKRFYDNFDFKTTF